MFKESNDIRTSDGARRLHVARFFAVIALCAPISVSAYSIDKATTEVRGDFMVTGAKQEMELAPGESERRMIEIINRTGVPRDFSVSIEDVEPSYVGESARITDDGGVYSLRRYITPEVAHFRLNQGERMKFSYLVSIPKDAEAGGRFGSVVIASESPNSGGGGASFVSRIGALVLVRVSGEVRESGYLDGFDVKRSGRSLAQDDASGFEIRYRNTGNVHTNLSGSILIRNFVGDDVARLDVSPFYSLPGSLRYHSVDAMPKLSIGRYTATLALYPGFGNGAISRTVAFWVIPGIFTYLLLLLVSVSALVMLKARVKKLRI